MLSEHELPPIAPPLLAWYGEHRRDLPWRKTKDPYRIWISEIMLQQTLVQAVIPYYLRFTEILPDVRALSSCPEEKLLKLWEGLGYYSRVLNMKKAAGIIVNEMGARMPGSFKELLALPGIGRYTAGAIASIAYGERVPAVDGNVLRIVSRLLKSPEDISRQAVKKAWEELLLPVVPGESPGDFNQALMDLGAMVCTGKGTPECASCPLYAFCRAGQAGEGALFPKKAAKKERRIEERTLLLLVDESASLLHRRPEGGLLGGLYEIPALPGLIPKEELEKAVRQSGLYALKDGQVHGSLEQTQSSMEIEELPCATHRFSHVEWRMIAYRIHMEGLAEQAKRLEKEGYVLKRRGEDGGYPIPSAFRSYAGYL